MKNLLYLFVSIFLILSVQSCKRMGDDDGNLLNDMDYNQGGIGEDRFLYQEVTSADTIAGYHYNGRKLVRVEGNNTVTNISYSGDQINKIDFTGVVDGDSIVYAQLFNYDPNNNTKLSTITETRTVYPNIAAQTAPLVFQKSRALYSIKFNANSKLDSVITRSGNEIPAQNFVFTSYQKSAYQYDTLWNVTKVTNSYGNVVGNVLGAALLTESYDFSNFDDKRSPYSLLPFGYLLHKTFENSFNSYRFSTNNPKRIMYSSDAIPLPILYNTLYTYDKIGYAISGWGSNYEYRPF